MSKQMGKLPDVFFQRLEQQFGRSATDRICAAFESSRFPTLRTNTIKTTDAAIMETFRTDRIAFERIRDISHAFRIKNRTDAEILTHPLCTNGHIYLQGIASMLPPIILDPQPGETILDLCAAPGSKTTQLAALMKNQGHIIACENDEVRFQKLLHTLRLQSATIVEPKCMDAALLRHEAQEKFDRILADVPCSAEGRIRLDEPRTYRFWSPNNASTCAKIQRRLLRAAAECLKPSGTLVYSTCTLAPEEDENMISWFLETFPNFKSIPFDLPLSEIRKTSTGGTYVFPSREHEGFFLAKMQKMFISPVPQTLAVK
ncbi:MAG: Ribosomal RNA small subunit methyltransferase B [Candidatus Uhrbacteria bacterium GW2011_GWF2_41_16]|uniref:Ribosomal RNA small subunit methyltransferase B n=2 Tax=Candidatus Uhriibacteriota TaxID=1752732 RepID=A0A0G0VBE1_9BACT|nr:MAG: Ribosomal RNA small subunit methyltransferase B [Candidatus Uhrbacteria bacterium GW2011_GWC2_41_11]KKR98209.1 MAG: Ribosomal RNA small subunit methyltransferase B [Candidatus Uhrbacteria bacterium GW2011_GWF2_41_16]HBP00537.1 hypothetical protein [Candidatus Uhrbacteria bacterium]